MEDDLQNEQVHHAIAAPARKRLQALIGPDAPNSTAPRHKVAIILNALFDYAILMDELSHKASGPRRTTYRNMSQGAADLYAEITGRQIDLETR